MTMVFFRGIFAGKQICFAAVKIMPWFNCRRRTGEPHHHLCTTNNKGTTVSFISKVDNAAATAAEIHCRFGPPPLHSLFLVARNTSQGSIMSLPGMAGVAEWTSHRADRPWRVPMCSSPGGSGCGQSVLEELCYRENSVV
eukprot:CAMPEP_0172446888 /NCGR_PEP_ID=MMETSP1065-20121228/6348_1 /TAXON_ID=265537 /ORGANISM="Amphiprora paludosa, Strain CCMP125" /LENGTH=139 /DNA_ID=CAMNT_0013198077 /DNA_START=192 /DNA_END=611 /DNA_ORIENTATION=-